MAPYVESLLTQIEGSATRAGQNVVGALTNQKAQKGLKDVAAGVLKDIEDRTTDTLYGLASPKRFFSWFFGR